MMSSTMKSRRSEHTCKTSWRRARVAESIFNVGLMHRYASRQVVVGVWLLGCTCKVSVVFQVEGWGLHAIDGGLGGWGGTDKMDDFEKLQCAQLE